MEIEESEDPGVTSTVQDETSVSASLSLSGTIDAEETIMGDTEFVSLPTVIIKDEPQDDPEISNAVVNEVTPLAEVDPMNLLQLGEQPDYVDHGNTAEGLILDTDSGCNLTNSTFEKPEEKWNKLMEIFTWFLHEDKDGDNGYCLYCDKVINAKDVYYLKQHAVSNHHKERGHNYIAFKNSIDPNNISDAAMVEIKLEYGTDSTICALKYKRMSQAEELNNFNWNRWLQDHVWLVRDEPDGTNGYCKFCRLHLNVEFTYLRVRHEKSPKHRRAENAYERKQRDKQIMMARENDDENEKKDKKTIQRLGSVEEDRAELDAGTLKRQPTACFEELDDNPTAVRCILCDVVLSKVSTHKHIFTKTHMVYLRKFEQQFGRHHNFGDKYTKIKIEKLSSSSPSQNWKFITKLHPWLIPDPNESHHGYCIYCEKVFMYQFSQSKRELHEHSAGHQLSVKLAKKSRKQERHDVNDENDEKNERKGRHIVEEEDEMDNAAEENDAITSTNSDEEKSEKNQVVEDYSNRIARGSDAWFAMYPWSCANPNDSTYFLCKYCNISLSYSTCRLKHELTARHRYGETLHLQRKKNKNKINRKQKESLYPWLVYTSSSKVYCKYCRIHLSRNFNRMQHEKTRRHLEACKIYKNKRRAMLNKPLFKTDKPSDRLREERTTRSTQSAQPSTNGEKTPEPKTAKPFDNRRKVSDQAIVNWLHVFPWLEKERNERRLNYFLCRICKHTLYIPTYKYATRHQKTSKHIRAYKLSRKMNDAGDDDEEEEDEEEEEDAQAATVEESVATSEENVVSKQQTKFSWLIPDKNAKFGYCQICEIRINVEGSSIKIHANSKEHRLAARSYKRRTNENEQTETSDKNNPVEKEDSRVINLSDDDEAISIKSEVNDDYEDGSYYLSPPAKRIKVPNIKAQIEKAKRYTEAHEELLRLTRDLGSNKNNKNILRNMLLSSLTPLSEQQRQHQLQNQSDSGMFATPIQPPPPSVPATPIPFAMPPGTSLIATPAPVERNKYDLFFESVSETIKKLPTDLAAEGKLKVMQLIYDLEMRALSRVGNENSDMTVATNNNSSNCLSIEESPPTHSQVKVLNPAFNTSQNNGTNCSFNTPNSYTNGNNEHSPSRSMTATNFQQFRIGNIFTPGTANKLHSQTTTSVVASRRFKLPSISSTNTSDDPIVVEDYERRYLSKNGSVTITPRIGVPNRNGSSNSNNTAANEPIVRCVPITSLKNPASRLQITQPRTIQTNTDNNSNKNSTALVGKSGIIHLNGPSSSQPSNTNVTHTSSINTSRDMPINNTPTKTVYYSNAAGSKYVQITGNAKEKMQIKANLPASTQISYSSTPRQ